MGYLMLLGLCLNANYNQNITDEEDEENTGERVRKKKRKGLIHLGHAFKAKIPIR